MWKHFMEIWFKNRLGLRSECGTLRERHKSLGKVWNVRVEVRVRKASWKALKMFFLECHAMQQSIMLVF